jgi:hypothetical protein
MKLTSTERRTRDAIAAELAERFRDPELAARAATRFGEIAAEQERPSPEGRNGHRDGGVG